MWKTVVPPLRHSRMTHSIVPSWLRRPIHTTPFQSDSSDEIFSNRRETLLRQLARKSWSYFSPCFFIHPPLLQYMFKFGCPLSFGGAAASFRILRSSSSGRESNRVTAEEEAAEAIVDFAFGNLRIRRIRPDQKEKLRMSYDEQKEGCLLTMTTSLLSSLLKILLVSHPVFRTALAHPSSMIFIT